MTRKALAVPAVETGFSSLRSLWDCGTSHLEAVLDAAAAKETDGTFCILWSVGEGACIVTLSKYILNFFQPEFGETCLKRVCMSLCIAIL